MGSKQHEAAHLPVGSLIQLRAEKWVQQGFCLGYLSPDNPSNTDSSATHPVFIHGAIPGETVSARITRSNLRHSFATVVEIIGDAAPDRITNDCAVFPECGGCSFRHIAYEQELALKLKLLEEQRFLHASLDDAKAAGQFAVHQAEPDGYRARTRVHQQGRQRPGYYALHSNQIVSLPPEGCRQLAPELNDAIHESENEHTVHANAGSNRHTTLELEVDETPLIGEQPWPIPPGAFFQANRFLMPRWLETVQDLLARHLNEPRALRCVELFCGTGLLGATLQNRLLEYTGYDNARDALRAGRQNFAARNMPGSFMNADLYRRPIKLPVDTDLLIANPPRAGLNKKQIPSIADAGIPWLLYSSCNPMTLNRDLGLLQPHGYATRAVHIFDFFPRTSHLEVLILLEKQR